MQTTQQEQLESLIVFKDPKFLKPRSGRNPVLVPLTSSQAAPDKGKPAAPRAEVQLVTAAASVSVSIAELCGTPCGPWA